MTLRFTQFLEGHIDVEHIVHSDSQKGAAKCSQGPLPHPGVDAMYYYQFIILLVWVQRSPQTTAWRPPPQLAVDKITHLSVSFRHFKMSSTFAFSLPLLVSFSYQKFVGADARGSVTHTGPQGHHSTIGCLTFPTAV